MKYRLYTYDVWGNRKDGFEVNQVFRTSTVIEIPDPIQHKDFVAILRKEGIIKPRVRATSVEIDYACEDVFYVTDARDGQPAFELRAEDSNG